MISLNRRTDSARGSRRTYLAAFSARDSQQLTVRIGELCNEALALVDAAASTSQGDLAACMQLWACCDRAGAIETQGNTKFSMSSLHLTIVHRAETGGRHVYSIATTITLFNPAAFDWLRDGRARYQERLVQTLLLQWFRAVRPPSPVGEMWRRASGVARAWIFGHPSRIFEYDQHGEVRPWLGSLPAPESAFVDGTALSGEDLRGRRPNEQRKPRQ